MMEWDEWDRLRVWEVHALESIAKSLNRAFPFTAVAGQLLLGGKTVSPAKVFQLSDASTGDPLAVVGVDAAGQPGAALAPGDSLTIEISDATVASFSPDASPLAQNYTDSNGVARTNVASMISGKVVPASPVKVGAVTTASYKITKADGSAGNTGSLQFQYVAGLEASEALVFDAQQA